MSNGVGEWSLIEGAGLYTEASPQAYSGGDAWMDPVGATSVDVPGVAPSVSLFGQATSVVASAASAVASAPGKAVQSFTGWLGETVGKTVNATISPLIPTLIIVVIVAAVALKISGIKPQMRFG